MLQRWFTRVCNDPILLSEEEVRSFIESDFGVSLLIHARVHGLTALQYQPMPRPRRRTSSGFSLLVRRPPDEDELLAQARFELTKLETQYIETAKAVDKLSQMRKGESSPLDLCLTNVIFQQFHLLMPIWGTSSLT